MLTSSPSPFSVLTDINSRAVGLLRDNSIPQALSLFNDALVVAERISSSFAVHQPSLHGKEAAGAPIRDRQVHSETNVRLQMHSVALDNTGIIPSEVSSLSSEHNSNTFAFYGRAVATSISPSQEGVHRRDIFETLFAVVMYNTGLLYHRHGLRTGHSKHLNKSLEIYRMALMVLHGYENGSDSSGGLDRDLLVMAIWNNLGHIHSHFIRTTEADACRLPLRSIFAKTNKPDYVGSVSREDRCIFVGSVLLSFVAGQGKSLQILPASAA